VFRFLDKFIEVLADIFAKTAQLALFLTMLIIVSNVLIRIWWKPIPGTYEIVELLGALLLSLGVAYCAMKKGHVSVDVIVEQFPARIQNIIDTLSNLIATAFIFAIGREAIRQSNRMMDRGLRTAHLHIPIHPFYFLVAFGIIMLGFVLLLRTIRMLHLSVVGEKKTEGNN